MDDPPRHNEMLAGPAGLAVAILALAVKDVRQGNGHAADARVFLAGPRAARWLALLGDEIDHSYTAADLQALVDET